jgi:hypothetical protein
MEIALPTPPGHTSKRVTTDKPQLKVYVRNQELIDALKKAAADDARTMSVLVDLILTEWLERRGYMKRGAK